MHMFSLNGYKTNYFFSKITFLLTVIFKLH